MYHYIENFLSKDNPFLGYVGLFMQLRRYIMVISYSIALISKTLDKSAPTGILGSIVQTSNQHNKVNEAKRGYWPCRKPGPALMTVPYETHVSSCLVLFPNRT